MDEVQKNLLERMNKCMHYIRWAPQNKSHYQELYELAREIELELPDKKFREIYLWVPTVEYTGSFGERYNFIIKHNIFFCNFYTISDSKEKLIFDVTGIGGKAFETALLAFARFRCQA